MKVQIIHIDNGSKFNFIKLKKKSRKYRFILRTIISKILKQNNPIERISQTIINRMRMTLIAYRLPESDWLYTETIAVYIINYLPTLTNPNNENLYKRFAKLTNILIKYLELPTKLLRTFDYWIYIYIRNEKVYPRIHKIIPTTRINRYYDYKSIYNYIYLIRINQIKQIIRIYDIRFHEDNPNIKDSPKNKIYKATFDKIDKKEENNIQIPIQQL